MRAQGLLEANPHPTDAEIRKHMEPNLCRCGTHMRILTAIRSISASPSSVGKPAAEAVR
jgi:aerobic-type carbon monoxide dehydrogenase small subunit (CoxS/CutS family)